MKIEKTVEEFCGLNKDEIKRSLLMWDKAPIKDILHYEILTLIAKTKSRLETAELSEIPTIRGEVHGLKTALRVLLKSESNKNPEKID